MVSSILQSVSEAIHAPQAKTARELFLGVTGSVTLLQPQWPMLGIVLYLLSKNFAKELCKGFGTTGKSSMFRFIALLHNLAICVFSFTASYNVWKIVYHYWNIGGIESVLCDSEPWTAGLNKWGLYFYFSKYWELVDTFLLIWKRRSPSFLQVYHHAVTIYCAYLLQASHAQSTFLFVGLNATIHTIMYAYYSSTLIGLKSRGIKPLITIMQLLQFIVGNYISGQGYFLRNGTCMSLTQKIAVGAINTHAMILIVLFSNFFYETYMKKKNKPTVKQL